MDGSCYFTLPVSIKVQESYTVFATRGASVHERTLACYENFFYVFFSSKKEFLSTEIISWPQKAGISHLTRNYGHISIPFTQTHQQSFYTVSHKLNGEMHIECTQKYT